MEINNRPSLIEESVRVRKLIHEKIQSNISLLTKFGTYFAYADIAHGNNLEFCDFDIMDYKFHFKSKCPIDSKTADAIFSDAMILFIGENLPDLKVDSRILVMLYETILHTDTDIIIKL